MITPCNSLAAEIGSGKMNDYFIALYGKDIDVQKQRYLRLVDLFLREMPGTDAMIVNAPGRTELGGNHTDHNHGCVLAAAVDLDCIAVITPVNSAEIILISEDYPETIKVDLGDLEPRPGEEGKPQALVRGMAAAFFERTGIRHGFYGRLHATCLPGTGLSSSAAFSVLVGASLNFLFYENTLSAEVLAIMARDAENDFFWQTLRPYGPDGKWHRPDHFYRFSRIGKACG